jgi:ABC-type multidrug transport system ATPase subunit
MGPEPPVAASALEKTYPGRLAGRGFRALRGIEFEVRPGEILGFLGPNGAGKTTTIKCILGLLRPTSGRVRVFGHQPGSAAARASLGYVPENPDYDESFTPREMLSMLSGMKGLDRSPSTVDGLLARVGLDGWGAVRMRKFSKGMRQRASLAAALLGSPGLLVMDEPTGGLDPAARKEFRDIILAEHGRGASILLSSHILSEVETVCSRAVILSRGEIVTQGSMEDLLAGENRYRIRHGADGAQSEEIVEASGLQDRIDSIRSSGRSVIEVTRHFRSLEEVFLKATGGSPE